jgi:tRNA(Ile)-lysidine synthase TilS/MesJ
MDFPVHKCQCPYGADSKRKKVREIIENLSDDYDGIKSNIFNSLSRIRTEYLT